MQVDDERYGFAESFRSLRSSLMFMPGRQQPLKSLLVTSSIPSEGKSTITSNLGITMALAGTRVLLIDADLRRGDLASLFDFDGRVGLSSVLRGEVEWSAVARPTSYANLTLIPRGPVTNQSSELLLSGNLEKLIAEWKAAFDLVLEPLFEKSADPLVVADDGLARLVPDFEGAHLTGDLARRLAIDADASSILE